GGDIAGDYRGVLPSWLGQVVRHHELRLRTDRRAESAVVAACTPVGREHLERLAAHEECVRTPPGVEDVLHTLVVAEGKRPAAAGVAGIHVLVVAAVRLCDAVEGDLQADGEFHGGYRPFTIATNGRRRFRQSRESIFSGIAEA